VDRGVGPVGRRFGEAVLHRVGVDVIDVGGEVALVPDGVLPVAALPDPAFAAMDSGGRARFPRRKATRKAGLDQHPAHGEVVVAFRQHPDAVKVAGSMTNASMRNGRTAAHVADRSTEGRDMPHQKVIRPASGQVDGEEITAAGAQPSIVRHDDAQDDMRRRHPAMTPITIPQYVGCR